MDPKLPAAPATTQTTPGRKVIQPLSHGQTSISKDELLVAAMVSSAHPPGETTQPVATDSSVMSQAHKEPGLSLTASSTPQVIGPANSITNSSPEVTTQASSLVPPALSGSVSGGVSGAISNDRKRLLKLGLKALIGSFLIGGILIFLYLTVL